MPSYLITALIIGGIAAAGAGLAHDIKGFVEGNTPWDDPLEWTKGHSIAAGTGFAGGALGSAVGPALGAAGNALGIGSNVGTQAAQSGAMTATELGGIVNPAASQVLTQAGTQATEATLGNVVQQALGRTAVGAGTGAIGNPDDPGRGALIGGAGALASSGVSGLSRIGFQGSGAGFVDANQDPTRGFSMMGGGGDFARAGGYNPSASFGLTPEPRMSVAGQAVGNAGGKLAGQLASGGMRSALTPTPGMPSANPYEDTPYGVRPYYARMM